MNAIAYSLEPQTAEPMIGKGIKFERIRRITGYLCGTLDNFNDAKRAEEHDRFKHLKLNSCGC